jgi:hypothetical protein
MNSGIRFGNSEVRDSDRLSLKHLNRGIWFSKAFSDLTSIPATIASLHLSAIVRRQNKLSLGGVFGFNSRK